MKKYLPFLFASVLPLSLFSWFIPTPVGQLDFLGLWWLAMIIIALPLLYTEIALAYRSHLLPLTGIAKLTREADASMSWRLFSWLSLLIALLIASILVADSSASLLPLLASMQIDIPLFALSAGLMVVATIVSVWGVQVAMAGLLLLLIGMGMGLINQTISFQPILTAISFAEWQKAVMLALVSVGAGSGLYWFAQATMTETSTKVPASRIVLPIWVTQLMVGTVSFLFISLNTSSHSVMVGLGSLGISALLLQCVSRSFSAYLGSDMMATIKGILVTLCLGCVLVLLPNEWKMKALIVLSCLTVMMLSIFSGWHMKISHLRKSLNFSNELIYNIWRIAVRLVVPLVVITVMIGWLKSWI